MGGGIGYIARVIQTVPGRSDALLETLREVAAAGWRTRCVVCQRGTETMLDNLLNALDVLGRTKADFGVRFEDDVLINRHLPHNLECWSALQEEDFGAGWLFHSFYVSTLAEQAFEKTARGNLRWPVRHIVGSLGVVLKLDVVRSGQLQELIRKNWDEAGGAQDKAMSASIMDLGRRVYAHSPPLVEHNVKHVSTLAPDRPVDRWLHTTNGLFDPGWKAS